MSPRYKLLAIAALVLSLTACSRTPVDKAIAGDLVASEANIVIAEHCRGCHVHAKFNLEKHIPKMQVRYPEKHEFRVAGQCLQCHELKTKWFFGDEFRATKRPHGNLIKMARIPVPGEQKRPKKETAKKPPKKKTAKKQAKDKEEKKKKRRWYFFYLF